MGALLICARQTGFTTLARGVPDCRAPRIAQPQHQNSDPAWSDARPQPARQHVLRKQVTCAIGGAVHVRHTSVQLRHSSTMSGSRQALMYVMCGCVGSRAQAFQDFAGFVPGDWVSECWLSMSGGGRQLLASRGPGPGLITRSPPGAPAPGVWVAATAVHPLPVATSALRAHFRYVTLV